MTSQELCRTTRELCFTNDSQSLVELVRITPPANFVDAIEAFSETDTLHLLLLLPPEVRAGLFCWFSVPLQDALLHHFSQQDTVQLINHLAADDRADIFRRMPEVTRNTLLALLDKAERDDIIRLSAWEEGTVGSVMTSQFFALPEECSVTEAIAHIRQNTFDKETIDVVYVVDSDKRLRGSLRLRDLVLGSAESTVAQLMTPEPPFAEAHWPQEHAAELIRRHDLLALPVVNSTKQLSGIVTVDDAMDIEKEQDATQLARFGGTTVIGGTDLDVIKSPLRKVFRVRVFWLAILTFFGIITSTFVAAQEEILSQVIVLAAFIAPIVDMGGNTGSQSATLVIRSMALGELKLKWRDITFIIKRELPVAAALGITIAILEAILAYFSKGVGVDVLLVVGLSMLVCTTLGGIIGALLPFAARRIGTDPATLSAPLITSIMDLIGVFIYFGFAYLFLGELLV
ncbi:magnesium transporter [Serratia marcescens]|uniref:magnesium transporter n=1 Tax=Serratia marcescens TaxID=615 RepID=UPI003204725B